MVLTLLAAAVDKIKAIHVYDFDNTREFPTPNPSIPNTKHYMSLTYASFQDTLTEPAALERPHDWNIVEPGNFHQWRLVAR
jgi:hypothetical protein